MAALAAFFACSTNWQISSIRSSKIELLKLFVKGDIMDKIEFFQDLEEIVIDPLFFGDSKEDIDQKIAMNTWSISISNELARDLTVKDFMDFFEKVISNRRKQIKNSNNQIGKLLYVWFDWQSGRIRFNVISDYNTKLPFNCKIEVIDKLGVIIEDFLRYPYHDGIPVEDVTDEDEEVEEEISLEPLKVFLYKISG